MLQARPNPDTADNGERGYQIALLNGLPALTGEDAKTAMKNIVGLLYPADKAPTDMSNAIARAKARMGLLPADKAPHNDGHDALREAIEALTGTPSGKKPDTHALGKLFSRMQGRIIGGKSLTSQPGRGGVVLWGVRSH